MKRREGPGTSTTGDKSAPQPSSSTRDYSKRRLESSRLLYFKLFLFAFIFRFAVHIGEATFATVLAVKVVRHENTGPTRIPWAFSPQAEDLAVFINFVVFQHCQLDLKVEGNITFTPWGLWSETAFFTLLFIEFIACGNNAESMITYPDMLSKRDGTLVCFVIKMILQVLF